MRELTPLDAASSHGQYNYFQNNFHDHVYFCNSMSKKKLILTVQSRASMQIVNNIKQYWGLIFLTMWS